MDIAQALTLPTQPTNPRIVSSPAAPELLSWNTLAAHGLVSHKKWAGQVPNETGGRGKTVDTVSGITLQQVAEFLEGERRRCGVPFHPEVQTGSLTPDTPSCSRTAKPPKPLQYARYRCANQGALKVKNDEERLRQQLNKVALRGLGYANDPLDCRAAGLCDPCSTHSGSLFAREREGGLGDRGDSAPRDEESSKRASLQSASDGLSEGGCEHRRSRPERTGGALERRCSEDRPRLRSEGAGIDRARRWCDLASRPPPVIRSPRLAGCSLLTPTGAHNHDRCRTGSVLPPLRSRCGTRSHMGCPLMSALFCSAAAPPLDAASIAPI